MAIYRIPVTLEFTGAGTPPGVNIWHCRVGLSGDPAADSTLTGLSGPIERLDAFYRTRLPDFGHGPKITIGNGVTEITDPNNPRGVEMTSPTMQGTTTAGLSPLLAVVIGWRTTLARRSGRGRTFWGPLIEGIHTADTGTPLATFVSDLQAHADALVNDSQAANGWAFGVYGLAQPGNALGGKVLRDFTDAHVNPKYAYLSSRRD